VKKKSPTKKDELLLHEPAENVTKYEPERRKKIKKNDEEEMMTHKIDTKDSKKISPANKRGGGKKSKKGKK